MCNASSEKGKKGGGVRDKERKKGQRGRRKRKERRGREKEKEGENREVDGRRRRTMERIKVILDNKQLLHPLYSLA